MLSLAIFWPVVSNSQSSKVFSTSLEPEKVEVPKYLFHWTDADSLARMAEFTSPSRLYLPELREGATAFGGAFPAFEGRMGLFTWVHPYTAMAHGDLTSESDRGGETYAKFRGRDGASPRLLTLKIRPDAKILVLRSRGASYPNLADSKALAASGVTSIDLVLHDRAANGARTREWIVMNADVVESFSADPRALPEEARSELARSLHTGSTFPPEQLFTEKPMNRPYRNRAVRAYFASAGEDLPSVFRRSLSTRDQLSAPPKPHSSQQNSAAAANASAPDAFFATSLQAETTRPPEYLFFWTNTENLKILAENVGKSGSLRLPHIDADYVSMSNGLPQFAFGRAFASTYLASSRFRSRRRAFPK